MCDEMRMDRELEVSSQTEWVALRLVLDDGLGELGLNTLDDEAC